MDFPTKAVPDRYLRQPGFDGGAKTDRKPAVREALDGLTGHLADAEDALRNLSDRVGPVCRPGPEMNKMPDVRNGHPEPPQCELACQIAELTARTARLGEAIRNLTASVEV